MDSKEGVNHRGVRGESQSRDLCRAEQRKSSIVIPTGLRSQSSRGRGGRAPLSGIPIGDPDPGTMARSDFKR